MTYFAANGRGYAVLILLLLGSTLAMLRAAGTGATTTARAPTAP